MRCKCNDTSLTPRWFKGDVEIKPSEKYSFQVVDGEFILVIKDADPKDGGLYSIIVDDVHASANLTVKSDSPMKEPILEMQPQTGTEGENVELTCSSNIRLHEPKWYKGDVEIFPSEKYSFQVVDGKYKLIIKNSSPEDDGLYKIKGNGYEVSASITING